jgi:hypothetical protein
MSLTYKKVRSREGNNIATFLKVMGVEVKNGFNTLRIDSSG